MPQVERAVRVVAVLVEGHFVAWDRHHAVLFGLNAAGKTHFLYAIKSLFQPQGSPSQATVLVQLLGEGDEHVGSWQGVDERWFSKRDLLARYVVRADGQLALNWAGEGIGHDEIEAALTRITLAHFTQGRCGDDRFVNFKADDPDQPPWLQELFAEIRGQRMFEVGSSTEGLLIRPFALGGDGFPHIGKHLEDVDLTLARIETENPSAMEGPLDFSPIYMQSYSTLDGYHVRGGPFFPGGWLTLPGNTGDWLDLRALDPDDLTDEDLTALTQVAIDRLDIGTSAELEDHRESWEESATTELRRFLPDAPELALHIPTDKELLTGHKPAWLLEHLSFAQRRLAALAILYAVGGLQDIDLLLIDEPERGLHRSSERLVAARLFELADRAGSTVWTATHSPAFLRQPDVAILKVERGQGLRILNSQTRQALADIGLTPTDILSSRRGFLIVEGTHDQIVLEELIGLELANLGVEVIPLHGGSKLPGSIESQLLFDYTQAKLFAMLDATQADVVARAWTRGRDALLASGTEAAKAVILDSLPAALGDEVMWLRTWLLRAIDRGVANRAAPVGLERADIIEYLPVEALVPGASSWAALRAVHQSERAKAGPRPIPKDFKQWLIKSKNADFSSPSIRRACQSMDHIPTDFTAALDAISTALTDR